MAADLERILATSTKFDEDLADEVLRSNEDAVFLLALARADCPAGLLVDVSQAPEAAVRRAVAAHPNTPQMTLRRMTFDEDESVARAARSRLA